MAKRKIITIDEEKCNGCGECVAACHEGAIQLVNGKAKLVSESYCDGLGDCLGECPTGALRVEEREAEPFDEAAVAARVREPKPTPVARVFSEAKSAAGGACPSGGCPGAALRVLTPAAEKSAPAEKGRTEQAAAVSELTHWPVQLSLLPPNAPFFRDADLLVTADCVPAAVPNFHADFLSGRVMALACPKLDEAKAHLEKLTAIFRVGGVRNVTVVRMEVPCCAGLTNLVLDAVQASGAKLPVDEVVVSVRGEVLLAERRLRPEEPSPAAPAVTG